MPPRPSSRSIRYRSPSALVKRSGRPNMLTTYGWTDRYARLDGGAQPRQPFGRVVERLLLFTEGESHEIPAVFLARVEARARHRGDADLLRHPLGECHVVEIAQRTEIGEHEVGAFRHRELEALFLEHRAQEVAPCFVTGGELVVVL